MPAVANAFKALNLRTAMLDGELVALRPDGVSSFPGLQAALRTGRDETLVFYAFDLLHLDGWDLRPWALVDRKAALHRPADWGSMLRFSEHVVGSPAAVHENAGQLGVEGIVCKRAGDPSIAWVRPGLVIEVEFAGWFGAGRMRHAVFRGIPEGKTAHDAVRKVADPESRRDSFVSPGPGSSKRIWHSAVPPRPKQPFPAPASDNKLGRATTSLPKRARANPQGRRPSSSPRRIDVDRPPNLDPTRDD